MRKSDNTDSEKRRKEDDENKIVDLLHQIKRDRIFVIDAIRLGKRPETSEYKPRPLKLTIASEEQKV